MARKNKPVKMYFYKQNKEIKAIERDVSKKIDEFVEIIKRNKKLKNYIVTFGLVGPTARGEGLFINNKVRSDFDFYVITKRINPLKEVYLKKKFYSIFEPKHVGILIASSTIFKRPDLMFFEFVNSGKILYGKRINAISLNKISRFESFRNLIYRSCFFLSLFNLVHGKLKLKSISKSLFLYYYSKIIFAIGEVMLLLTREYIAYNKKRNELIKNNKFAKLIKGFIEEHQKMQEFREKLKVPEDFSYNLYIKRAFYYLLQCYEILFKEIFKCNNPLNCTRFKRVRAKGLSFISTRFFFSLNYFLMYKKIKIHIIKEPFIVLSLMMYKLLKNIHENKEVRKQDYLGILRYWKTAGWFYYWV